MSSSPLLQDPNTAANAALNPDASSSDFSVVPAQPAAQQPTTSPTATPQYPDSPDQNPANNPVAGTSDDNTAAAPVKHSLFRNILIGALSGIENHLKGAGEGLITGGIGGAVVGAVNPKLADNALKAQQSMRNSEVQQARYVAANAQEQLAINQTHLLELQREYSMLPKTQQESFDRAHESELRNQYNTLTDSGNASQIQNFGDWQDSNAWAAFQTLHSKYMAYGTPSPFNYVPSVNPEGDLVMLKVHDPNQGLHEAQTIATNQTKPDGSPITITVPAGTPWAQYQGIVLQSQLDDIKSARKISEADSTGVTAKNQATATKNNAQASAAASNTAAGEWRPKVTADEKKKTELAENGMVNINEIASIIQRRQDLFGPAAGRVTSVEQMLGSNDRDITALATAVHNLAMVNSGIHGFRSQEGVKSYEQMVLNNFKNGPQAVVGALRAAATSAQTFIDNGRPESYRTHSKQGGGLRGMLPQGGK
jgi:hypothetical protein